MGLDRIRIGLVAGTAGAVALAAALTAGCGSIPAAGRPELGGGSPAVTHSVAPAPPPRSPGDTGCHPTLEVPDEMPTATRSGQLVPEGATGGAVCTYFDKDGTSGAVLIDQRPLKGDPAALIDYLNGLSATDPATLATPAPGEHIVHECLMAGFPVHQFVLSYPARSPAVVTVNSRCGTVEQGGAVRYTTGLHTLMAYWQS